MKQVLSQDVAEAHHGSFFLVRYQRILHLVCQNHHFDAIHLLSDLIEESTDSDELLALYRLWIDLLSQEGVQLPVEGAVSPAAGKDGLRANPQLQALYDHLQQLHAEQADPAEPAEMIYQHSWLALGGLAGLYLGHTAELKQLLSSFPALLRSPYTEELDFRLAQHYGPAFKLNFQAYLGHTAHAAEHFVATQAYFERPFTKDPEGGFYDYPLMRSLVEYGLISQQDALVERMLGLMDEWFGWTTARGLLELDRALQGQDRAATCRAVAGLRTHSPDEWEALAQQLGHLDQAGADDQETLLQRYHEACAEHVQQLATQDLAAEDTADSSDPAEIGNTWAELASAYGVKTDAELRGARAWLCPISARGYEAHFLQHTAHKNMLLGMEDKVRRGDRVLVVSRVHEGSRLLGIYEICFAPRLAGYLSIPKVLKPVQVFDHQQHPTIKLPTYDIDSSAAADIRRRHGLEELLELTADSLRVILDEIKEQTALGDDTLVIFDDKNWQHFA